MKKEKSELTLEEKIANTPIEVVKASPEFAKKIFNLCRHEVGLKEEKF
jgi:hypothetical protein